MAKGAAPRLRSTDAAAPAIMHAPPGPALVLHPARDREATGSAAPGSAAPASTAPDRSVAVVITTRNYARFLADALDSVLAQSVPAAQVLVVDDGSTDDPAAVMRRYPAIPMFDSGGRGISAARNVGLAQVTARYVIFVDADDVLTPDAILAGLDCHEANPGAGFVYGGYMLVDAERKPLGDATITRIHPRAYQDLLRDNFVRMHAAVMYDRACLAACGGFDETIPRCEDHDMYLRLARRFRVACHPAVAAEYRLHGANMSLAAAEMLAWQLGVLERHRPGPDDADALRAWEAGHRHWKRAFTNFAWSDRGASGPEKWKQRVKMMRVAPRITPGAAIRQMAVRVLPAPLVTLLRRIRRPRISPGLGEIDFGDFARLKPLDRNFGYGRGNPVDRYYIERFLAAHRADIKGRVLEVGTPDYSQRFGSGIAQQDVLNINDDPGTTIRGDFEDDATLPSDTFDCMIFTQALQYAYRPEVALRNLYRALKPGGVLLATLPSITPVDNAEWQWYWSFAPKVAARLFDEAFGRGQYAMDVHGNVFAATCFLQGIAVEDVSEQWLDPADPAYPVNITVRAVKPA